MSIVSCLQLAFYFCHLARVCSNHVYCCMHHDFIYFIIPTLYPVLAYFFIFSSRRAHEMFFLCSFPRAFCKIWFSVTLEFLLDGIFVKNNIRIVQIAQFGKAQANNRSHFPKLPAGWLKISGVVCISFNLLSTEYLKIFCWPADCHVADFHCSCHAFCS